MMKKNTLKKLFLLLWSVFPLIYLSCQNKPSQSDIGRVVAQIEDFKITYGDLIGQFDKKYPNIPITKANDGLKRGVLDDMIKQHIILREAYRLGYNNDEEVVRLSKTKEQILAGSALEKREAYDKVITEDLIKHFYKLSDRELHLRRMLFKCGTTREQEAKALKKAEGIYAQLQNGGDFKTLAAKYSEHVNAAKDSGDIYKVGCFDIDEEIFSQAYKLSEGEVSKPFFANYAYYLVMVEKVFLNDLKSFETERPNIEKKLDKYYGVKLSRQFHEFRNTLMREFHYTLLPQNIDFFCTRARTMKTKQDSASLFTDDEKNLVLYKTDVNELTIGKFFGKTFQYFWNALDQKKVVEMLLAKDCYHQLRRYKGMTERLNELPEVKDKHDEWLVGFLKSYVLEKEVFDKIDVSDKVLEPIYRARMNSLIFKERRTVREIFQKTEEGIRKVHDLAINGSDFEALEKQYQQNRETRTNGIVGPFTKGPNGKLGETAFKMKVGEISTPFRYRGGYSIIKLLSIEPERKKTFEEAKEELKNEYIDTNGEKFTSDWYARIKKNYKITIYQI